MSTQVEQEDVERLGKRGLSLGSHGYVQMWDGYVALLHRWIMGAVPHDGKLVDHENGDVLDNQKSNLKFVTPSESTVNRTTYAISGFRGVHKRKSGRWAASAHFKGVQYNLGTYDTAKEAAEVAHVWRLNNLPGYTGDIQREVHVNDPRIWIERKERKEELVKVRIWAAEHGLFLSERGRISNALLASYRENVK